MGREYDLELWFWAAHPEDVNYDRVPSSNCTSKSLCSRDWVGTLIIGKRTRIVNVFPDGLTNSALGLLLKDQFCSGPDSLKMVAILREFTLLKSMPTRPTDFGKE